ncbi:hypothetical protein HPB50_026070 [Hyalomma asiaticum]|uniref:Uncharacterized protein n=1 Tax=Hyalomma asiaticum TaxID=266040 RepID=A0ACB7T774_HYAAI|nr:hypothetical protein HPB50_026070 [Hyalomma asiaticum]
MWIDARGCNADVIKRIETQANSMLRMISRVTSKHEGLREDLLLRVFDAFFINHVNYAAPYMSWTQTEKRKLDALIRTGLKRTLGLPQTTGTERLLEFGLHNSIDELVEAHFTAQRTRLSSTKAGIKILDEPGMAALPGIELKERTMLTCKEREDIEVDPIPRHVHPVHRAGRRVARARAIIRGIRNRDATFFVDAAEYHCETAFAVAVVDGGGNRITTATIRTNSVSVAEEAAIALALQAATTPATIYSDSRTAVRAFSAGTVSSLAARILCAATTWKGECTSGPEFQLGQVYDGSRGVEEGESVVLYRPVYVSIRNPTLVAALLRHPREPQAMTVSPSRNASTSRRLSVEACFALSRSRTSVRASIEGI